MTSFHNAGTLTRSITLIGYIARSANTNFRGAFHLCGSAGVAQTCTGVTAIRRPMMRCARSVHWRHSETSPNDRICKNCYNAEFKKDNTGDMCRLGAQLLCCDQSRAVIDCAVLCERHVQMDDGGHEKTRHPHP